MTLQAELRQAVHDRDATTGWRRQATEALPEPAFILPYQRVWLSRACCTIGDTRTRLVVGGGVTDGEVARAYLRQIMGHAAEATGRARLAHEVPWPRSRPELPPPAYYFRRPPGPDGWPGPFELVDVRACYASVYSRLTLDVVWEPDTHPPMLGLGVVPFERTAEWARSKGPRNALVGVVMRRYVREWHHGVPVDDRHPNRLHAPYLVGAVLDAVHQLAVAARDRFRCISWSVDGGLFRPEDGAAFRAWSAAEWGLTATVRAEGPGWAWGPNCWHVGGLETLDVSHGSARQWGRFDNLVPRPRRAVDLLAATLRGLA